MNIFSRMSKTISANRVVVTGLGNQQLIKRIVVTGLGNQQLTNGVVKGQSTTYTAAIT